MVREKDIAVASKADNTCAKCERTRVEIVAELRSRFLFKARPFATLRCMGCRKNFKVCTTCKLIWTGCSMKCRRTSVILIERLMKTKLGSAEEAEILRRMRS